MPHVPMPHVNRQEVGQAVDTAKSFLPPPERIAYYGGLGALAVAGLIEWPVAAAIGVGILIAQRARGKNGPARSSSRRRAPRGPPLAGHRRGPLPQGTRGLPPGVHPPGRGHHEVLRFPDGHREVLVFPRPSTAESLPTSPRGPPVPRAPAPRGPPAPPRDPGPARVPEREPRGPLPSAGQYRASGVRPSDHRLAVTRLIRPRVITA